MWRMSVCGQHECYERKDIDEVLAKNWLMLASWTAGKLMIYNAGLV